MATKKYLDYAGLKRVLAKLLPGARKIWHGTLAEWEVLSAAEKAKYDQAEVIDEYTGVPVVVDKVESGNLNPVTSNAVAADRPEYYDKQLTVTAYENAQLSVGSAYLRGQKVLCKDGKTRIFGEIIFFSVTGNANGIMNKHPCKITGFPGTVALLAGRMPCLVWAGWTGFYGMDQLSSGEFAPIIAGGGTPTSE